MTIGTVVRSLYKCLVFNLLILLIINNIIPIDTITNKQLNYLAIKHHGTESVHSVSSPTPKSAMLCMTLYNSVIIINVVETHYHIDRDSIQLLLH